MIRYPLAVALLVLAHIGGVHAAGAPTPPTRTPTAAPTATPIPSSTSTLVPSPSPSPTPATIGGSSSASCPNGIFLPVPFTGGWCLDAWSLLASGWDGIWTGLTHALQDAIQSVADAILGPLTQTPNPAGNSTYSRVESVLAGDATDVFAVMVGLGALWCAWPAMFGSMAEGIALLWRAALALAAVRSIPLLVGVWSAAANALSGDIGHATITDVGHSGMALLLAPVLLVLAGIERAVSLDVFGLMYMLAPLAIVCFVWPPSFGIGMAWLRTFAYLSLLGPAYALAAQAVVGAAMQGGATGLWSDVLLVGGLLLLDLVPAIMAGLFGAAAHASMNLVRNLAMGAAKIGG